MPVARTIAKESGETLEDGGGEASARGEGSVSKALTLLDCIAEADRPLRFTELLARAPFPKATLHRMLRMLVHERVLAYDDASQTYSLGARLLRLAHAAWERADLAAVARPTLDALSADLGETLHLAQLDAGQVLYLDKRDARRVTPMFSGVGKVGPAYCTGVGKAMLAALREPQLTAALERQAFKRHTASTITTVAALREELEAIRRRGYAVDREEHEDGINCVAAAIVSPRGALFGAISVTGPQHRTPRKALERLAPKLRAAALEIARAAEVAMTPALR